MSFASAASAIDAPRAWALVLGAGTGSRFGGAKLLAPLHGRPLIEHALDTVASLVADGTLAGGVLVAPEAPAGAGLEQIARRRGLETVHPRPGAGLSDSLRAGLACLAARAGPADAAAIIPGDQPALRPGVLRELTDRFRGEPAAVHRPVYLDQPDTPGHPVLLPRRLWDAADALTGDRGFSALLADAGVRLHPFPGDNPDVDSPEDLARLESRP